MTVPLFCSYASGLLFFSTMTNPASGVNRRGRTRPTPGEWMACPNCRDGMLVFTERDSGNTSSSISIPAWVCDRCPTVTFVRAHDQPAVVRESARNVRAKSQRTLMKSSFVRGRANRALHKSQARKRKNET